MATNGNHWNSNESSFDTERTESDATHFRLRQDFHPTEFVRCLSCDLSFPCTSILQIYEHYSEQEHTSYYGSCLYCKGKVHRYYTSGNNKNHIEIYHNCLRWKRGEDK